VRLLRPGPVTRFALLSLAPILALGIALTVTLGDVIHDRVLTSVRDEAGFVTNIALPAYIPASHVTHGLNAQERALLRAALGRVTISERVDGIRIVNRRGVVVFDSRPKLIGTSVPIAGDLARALDGEVVSTDARLDREGVFVVTVPLTYYGRTTIGAVSLYFPSAEVANTIAQDVRKLYMILAAGLALLYAMLLPTVARAARELRKRAAEQEHLANHDQLTGLGNRGLFERRLDAALSTLEQPGTRVGLMMADVDSFKEVNDTYGHHAGDAPAAGDRRTAKASRPPRRPRGAGGRRRVRAPHRRCDTRARARDRRPGRREPVLADRRRRHRARRPREPRRGPCPRARHDRGPAPAGRRCDDVRG
jgi:hypothetical protein